MQLDQIINWIKANPAPFAIGVGVYLVVGALVLWRVCRSGGSAPVTLTSFARITLTALFALPIWPIVWIVWVLHFRKFAPDAIDLTRFRLPVIDLSSHRADDVRFAPKNKVVDAEIVDSPRSPSREKSTPSSTTAYKAAPMTDAKPKVKTTPVSSVAKDNRPAKEKVTASDPTSAPEKKTTPEPDPRQSDGLKSATPAPAEPRPAASPPPSGSPPPPKVKRPSPPPSSSPAPVGKAPAAPSWPSVAVDPRTPEPPSAPPFVRKMERGETVKTVDPAAAPAPFPDPTSSPLTPSSPAAGGQSKPDPASPKKPDVPEIPIH